MYGSEKAKSNPFVMGTKNLKLEAIKDHESSKKNLHTINSKVPSADSCGQGTGIDENSAVGEDEAPVSECPHNRKEDETLL